jgi:hypothetical protein
MFLLTIPALVLGIGALLTLAGVLGVGAQVRTHRIDPRSRAARLLRAGGLVLLAGQVWAGFARDTALLSASVIVGLGLLVLSAAMVGHEWRQAGERTDPAFRLARNGPVVALDVLRLCVVVAALLLIGGLALGRLHQPLLLLPVVVVMINLGGMYALGSFIAPEWRRAGFRLGQSLSLQVFLLGIALSVVGLIGWNWLL